MTTLLLTDIPPCSNLTAGIVTAQMCRAVLPDPIAVFCVLNPGLQPEPYPDLAALPARTVRKPSESAVRRAGPLPIGGAGAALVELRKRLLDAPRLAREAAAFGREVGARRLWCVLQGQTMVRLARPVAGALGVPLHAHIWDPFSWWQRAHATDALNAALDRRAFDATLRACASAASASWAMAEHLARSYGVPGEPVIAALHPALARRPPLRDGRFVIAMAGQFYADREWATLLAALDAAGWRVAGREAALLTFGPAPPPGKIPPGRLDHRGWQPQPEVVRAIAEEADAAFCPYPFAAELEEVARLSFPSKLPTFFAAGRPVLFHGPAYASPAAYLRERGAGLVADEPGAAALGAALARLAEDRALQESLAEAGQRAFRADFTLAAQRAAVRRFLRLSDPAPATPAPA